VRQEYVYVLGLGYRQFKIGRTVNPNRRFKQMQLPTQPVVVGMFPCQDSSKVERELHERFSFERRHGEWFELSPSRAAEPNFWCAVLTADDERTGKAPAKVYDMRRK
jgi:hypothetical protein